MLKLVKLDDQTLPGIADAIREKNGETAEMLPRDMPGKIWAIPGPKPEQDKAVEVTENGTTEVLPDTGKVLSKVTITANVPGKPEEPGVGNFTENGDFTVEPTPGSVFSGFTAHVQVPEIRIVKGEFTPAENTATATITFNECPKAILIYFNKEDAGCLVNGAIGNVHYLIGFPLTVSVPNLSVYARFNNHQWAYSGIVTTLNQTNTGITFNTNKPAERFFQGGIKYNYNLYYWDENWNPTIQSNPAPMMMMSAPRNDRALPPEIENLEQEAEEVER